MLLFDNSQTAFNDPLKELVSGAPPDVIEIGEKEDHWLQVRRSTRKIELRSKQTGQIVARYDVNAAALQYGLSERQLDAAKRGLAL